MNKEDPLQETRNRVGDLLELTMFRSKTWIEGELKIILALLVRAQESTDKNRVGIDP